MDESFIFNLQNENVVTNRLRKIQQMLRVYPGEAGAAGMRRFIPMLVQFFTPLKQAVVDHFFLVQFVEALAQH